MMSVDVAPWTCAMCGHHEVPDDNDWHRDKVEVLGKDGALVTVCDRCQILATIVSPSRRAELPV